MIVLSEDEIRKLTVLAGRAECEFRHALTLAIDHACKGFAAEMNEEHDAYEAERTRKWEKLRKNARAGGAGVRRGRSNMHDGETVPIKRGISKVEGNRPTPPPVEQTGRDRDSSGRWSTVGDESDGAAIEGRRAEGTEGTRGNEE